MRRDFISYPKSGRSWIRYALLQTGTAECIHFHHDGFEFNDGSLPPHNFDAKIRLKNYEEIDRLVYLERDPRDIICSLYHQITGRFKDFFNYQESISQFIRDPYFGAENLQKFRQMWEEIRVTRDIYVVSYEEMSNDPMETLSKLTEYYEFQIDKSKLFEASQKAGFENMKNVELEGSFSEPWLRPRNGATKVRRGVVGSHLLELESKDIDYLNSVFLLSN